ncbi:MAG: winged helix-turn-helix transcriptional regulator [Candidatus Zixiibacteriota bacterium]
MKMRAVLELSNIRIMLYLLERGSARYSEVLKGVGLSRGALALALRDLQDDGLTERRVEATRPIQTTYSLTAKGKEIAKHLESIKKLI